MSFSGLLRPALAGSLFCVCLAGGAEAATMRSVWSGTVFGGEFAGQNAEMSFVYDLGIPSPVKLAAFRLGDLRASFKPAQSGLEADVDFSSLHMTAGDGSGWFLDAYSEAVNCDTQGGGECGSFFSDLEKPITYHPNGYGSGLFNVLGASGPAGYGTMSVSRIDIAPIPLPAGLPLLALAIAGLIVAARQTSRAPAEGGTA